MNCFKRSLIFLDALKVERTQLELQLPRLISVPSYTGSRTDLELELNNIQQIGRNIEEEQDNFEGELEKVEKDLKIHQFDADRITKSLGTLEAQTERRETKLQERNQLFVNLTQICNIDGPDTSADPDYQCFRKKLDERRDFLLQQQLSTEKSFDMQINEVQNERRACDIKKAKLEQSFETNKTNAEKYQLVIEEIIDQLNAINQSQNRLTTLDEEIKEIEHQIEKMKIDFDELEIEREIIELKGKRNECIVKTESLHKERTQIQDAHSLLSSLEHKENERQIRMRESDRILNLHRNTLIHFLGLIPDTFLKDTISGKMAELTDKRQAKEKENTELEREIAQLEDMRKTLQKDIQRRTDLQRQHSLRISQKKGLTEGGKAIYRGFKDQLENNQCCPLCERAIDLQVEMDNLITKVERKVTSLPTNCATFEKDIRSMELRRTDLLSIQTLVNSTIPSEKAELLELEQNLLQIGTTLNVARERINSVSEEMDTTRENERILRQVEADASLVDSVRRFVSILDKEIAQLKAQLQSNAEFRTFALIDADFEAVQITMKTADSDLDTMQNALQNHRIRGNSLVSTLNELKRERLTIMSKSCQMESFKAKERECTKSAEECIFVMKTDQSSLLVVEERIKELDANLVTLKDERTRISSQMNDQLLQFSSSITRLKSVENELDLLATCQGRLLQCQREKLDLNSRITALKAHEKQLNSQLKNIHDQLADKQGNVLKLRSQLNLIDTNSRLEEINSEINEKERTFGGMNLMQMEKKRVDLQSRTNDLRGAMQRLEGAKQELESKVDQMKQSLQDDKIRNADENYRDAKIDQVTLIETIKVVGDLHKYATALDAAIIDYHSGKMEEINVLLADYWRRIYRRADVDGIRIKSDGIDTGLKRRKYNYSVVMTVEGKEVDMRDRCSAGQKVLACILIRLALGDVFCGTCGMITLDEPTTNLDYHKVESLANALHELIELRGEQANFQLVVITHDERLVDLLYRHHRPECLLSVNKDQDGYTVVKRHRDLDDFIDDGPS